MMKQLEGFDMAVPYLIEERPEPLCAIYRKSTKEVFKELISRKEYAVHQSFTRVRTKFVPIGPELPFYRPDLFLNINREEDLKELPGDFVKAADEN
jgi:molybdopterin-guanine dinucleotide biosynthesis protein A